MLTLEILKNHFEKQVNRADAVLSKFKADLEKDPVHAFRWADGTMEAVSKAQVAKHYLASIQTWEELKSKGQLGKDRPQTEEEVVNFVLESVTRQALTKARFTNQSTSMCANKMESEERAAYADLAADWNMIW